MLAMADQLGGASYRQLQERLPYIEVSNAKNYCVRCVKRGFMTVDKSGAVAIYTAAKDWRMLVERVEAPRIGVVNRIPTKIINSVWSLGA